eukprot:3497646-Alexandrium_andersonii.AAC.1
MIPGRGRAWGRAGPTRHRSRAGRTSTVSTSECGRTRTRSGTLRPSPRATGSGSPRRAPI